jgi:hypothetical protein
VQANVPFNLSIKVDLMAMCRHMLIRNTQLFFRLFVRLPNQAAQAMAEIAHVIQSPALVPSINV